MAKKADSKGTAKKGGAKKPEKTAEKKPGKSAKAK
jgi:hypothetical protein